MSREVRRVPSGFGWPLNKTWTGYLEPEWLHLDACPDCYYGYGPEALVLYKQWYGNLPFRPEDNDSVPVDADTPHVRAAAERNVAHAPKYYGTGELAIRREGVRLARLYNGYLSHHLSQQDVDELYDMGEMDRLTHKYDRDLGEWVDVSNGHRYSAAEINVMQSNFIANPVDMWSFLKMRAARDGFDIACKTCGGDGSAEKWVGQKKAAKKWKPTKPPKGPAWQLWETTSEGSPVTPAFDTPEELARHMIRDGGDFEKALEFVTGEGWAPTMVSDGSSVRMAEDIATGREGEPL
jgi:hypothetical protein